MNRLYPKEATAIVEGVRIESLRIAFKVERSLGKIPNSAELQLYNLTPHNRAKLQKKGAPFALAAGDRGRLGRLFLGETRRGASHVRQGTDWVTKVPAGDGQAAYSEAQVSESFGPGAKVTDVVRTLAKKAGVAAGNAVAQLAKGNFRGGLDEFTHGFVANGNASSELDRVLRSAGFDWSIQDGQLQILRGQEVAQGQAIQLTPDTGLLDSPELGSADKKKGPPKVKAKCLLHPGLKPGGVVDIQSEGVKGQFRIEKVVHEGDTHGPAWFSTLEAVPL